MRDPISARLLCLMAPPPYFEDCKHKNLTKPSDTHQSTTHASPNH